jgi:hypothetical protein
VCRGAIMPCPALPCRWPLMRRRDPLP